MMKTERFDLSETISAHYMQRAMRVIQKLPERFMARVEKDASTGCWFWLGQLMPNGYGTFGIFRRNFYAHRVAYALWRGPIPSAHDVDHLCRVRRCVNPNHLEAVTRRENLYRGNGPLVMKRLRTHCIHGHPFDAVNTYIYRGMRHCRACGAARQKVYATRTSD